MTKEIVLEERLQRLESPPQKKRGRPLGSGIADKQERVALAEALGLLPHDFLLSVMNGNPVQHLKKNKETGKVKEITVYPNFRTRMDAAKYAAPFFAPKLLSKDVSKTEESIVDILKILSQKLPG